MAKTVVAEDVDCWVGIG